MSDHLFYLPFQIFPSLILTRIGHMLLMDEGVLLSPVHYQLIGIIHLYIRCIFTHSDIYNGLKDVLNKSTHIFCRFLFIIGFITAGIIYAPIYSCIVLFFIIAI